MARIRFPVGRGPWEWHNAPLITLPDDPSIYPQITLDRAISWHWRVRRWVIKLGGQFHQYPGDVTLGTVFDFGGVTGSEGFTGTVWARVGDGESPGPDYERDLMTAPFTFHRLNVPTQIWVPPFHISSLTGLYDGTDAGTINAQLQFGTGGICPADQQVHPGMVYQALTFQVSPGDDFLVGNLPEDTSVGTSAIGFASVDTSFPVIRAITTLYDGGRTDFVPGFSMRANPDLWWGYPPEGDGTNPENIYEPTTGGRLLAYEQPPN